MSAQLRRLVRPLQRLSPARRPLSVPATAVRAATPAAALHAERALRLQNALRALAGLGLADQSRVQLALRSLEQASAPVRVAVLAAPAQAGRPEPLRAPARFLRLLLADPRSPGPAWEHDVEAWCARGGRRGLLLRYAATPSPITAGPNSPISVLSLPSPFLLANNVEILLSRLPAASSAAGEAYVPTLVAPLPSPGQGTLPKAPSRSTGMVMRYPVHKTILFSDGLEDLLTTTALRAKLAEAGDADQKCILSVACLPGVDHRQVRAQLSDRIALLDLDTAERASNESSRELPAEFRDVREWLAGSTVTPAMTPIELNQATKTLVSSIFASASAKLVSKSQDPSDLQSELLEETASISNDLPANSDNVKTLTTGIQNLAKNAHNELHNSLDQAFSSRFWTKDLAWYRLYFNHENIPYFSSMAIQNHFVPETEKAGWAFAGRMWGAGFRNFSGKLVEDSSSTPVEDMPTPAQIEISKVIAAADSVITDKNAPGITAVLADRPFLPPYIPNGLQHVMTVLIPRLHSSAIRHVLRSASLGFSSALTTVLLYLSDISFYTSFSVTALGSVISMGYLQNRWAKEKRRFEGDVREVGRKSIVDMEKWGWDVLRASIEQTAVANRNSAAILRPAEQRIQKATRAIEDGLQSLKELEAEEKSGQNL
ncbi:hypothetical protein DFH27DRAFT_505198 [Peziza echinospora]|nr:hypothetical protein DFH27DRAFT_505198 [Peziza echinospora]